MIEIDPETIIDKGKILVKIDAVITIEGTGTRKILVEIMAEVEAEILTETTVMIEVDQEKEGYHPEGTTIITITDKTQILEYGLNLEDQGLEVDPNSRVRTNRDRIRCYRCREYDHYASECQNAVASDSEGYDSDNAALQIMATEIESDDTRDIERYREDTEYLNL